MRFKKIKMNLSSVHMFADSDLVVPLAYKICKNYIVYMYYVYLAIIHK
jgi:hypothetical protein